MTLNPYRASCNFIAQSHIEIAYRRIDDTREPYMKEKGRGKKQ